ncbi:hypothetical protein JY97_13570 [Alkalispirochaeta odontotermitis]|nr:hypothetical protein JY97_13570 [Alkalispirochaeta odontotermitis]CAB1077249.1 hypothetical protein D1AOALGA4SA_5041 [Olavius algarvensis Delta 1 endosymbiont]
MKRIAYFISPHGFGHAARAAAVMQAISDLDDSVGFEIFTTVPSWFFEDSLSASFSCHALLTDIGLVQISAFQADLDQTLRSLDVFLPFPASLISDVSTTVSGLDCGLVICDISPLGIAIAKDAGIPSLLVENFTWEWMYEPYAATDERFRRHIDCLHSLYQSVNYHIQTEPVCCRNSADLTTPPVSRKILTPGRRVKRQLDTPDTARLVLVTAGGINQGYTFMHELQKVPDVYFVLPGAGPEMQIRHNCIILPHRSNFYHPDLVNACDAVVGKVGYSTLAEVFRAGIPFGYVTRSDFRESASMAAFIENQMPGFQLEESDFSSGRWIAEVSNLLELGRVQQQLPNGAEAIGQFVLDRL